MNSIVKFPTPPDPEPRTDIEVDFQDPFVLAILAQAEQLVDFDINTTDIEELRLHTKNVIMTTYHDFKLHDSIIRLTRHCIANYRREELHKYLASGKSDSVAAAKALAYNRVFKLLPKHLNSWLFNGANDVSA